ncbi:MAG TPA: ABC transporter permease subunit [Dongiaceae bacterium]|jgi:His/Glu/Gln/Arg/opine family amino acid ABC transporter permease subunit|nr:ABC transporter permease subunit [Dongiaceae bacterium]
MFDLGGYGHLMWSGAALTVVSSIMAMVISILFGLIGASAKLSRHRFAHFLASAYTIIIRGVPELILLLLVFFGGTILLQNIVQCFNDDVEIDINAFAAGVGTLGFVYGAYATEAFRGAFQALPKGQIEAATAIGMNRRQVFLRIKLPQVWRFALPGLGNVWLVLLKATSLMSVLGFEELTRNSEIVTGAIHRPFAVFFLASMMYLAMTAISNLALHGLERRANRGIRRG